jgi:hypothetical protein
MSLSERGTTLVYIYYLPRSNQSNLRSDMDMSVNNQTGTDLGERSTTLRKDNPSVNVNVAFQIEIS